VQLFLTPQRPSAIAFTSRILAEGREPLRSLGIETLQVNVGYQCNQACSHCHIEAGPARSERMTQATAARVLQALAKSGIGTLDITGGAPELHPVTQTLVTEARRLGRRVIVRTNLTILSEPGMEDLPKFYREHDVELIASLPCYSEENVDRVRGSGTFTKCLEALGKLNALGYGRDGRAPLSLVYNPAGPFLAPSQDALERDYKRELQTRYGITFTRLYAFTNMPIGRFRERLSRENGLNAYQDMLVSSFNSRTLDRLMCRRLISVGWDGALYDCDFNQALGLPVTEPAHAHIERFDHEVLSSRMIALDDHCYACTAGQGSS